MKHKFISSLKNLCAVSYKYNFDVAISCYRYDVAKSNGQLDTAALARMHRAILAYLKKKYAYLIEKYKDEPLFQEQVFSNCRNTIWCFWWQGIENAPELVRVCVASIIKNNPACNVVIIDQTTYKQYVELPDWILDKVQRGLISFTLFSDILRFNLLKRWGGIWMDSTIFCVESLPTDYLTAPIFTAKSAEAISECPANYRWTCYLMAGCAENIIFRFLVDFFDAYFQEHKTAIQYFLVDYGVQLAYDNIDSIRRALDSIPINNEKRGFLTKHLCNEYTEQFSIEKLRNGTQFYKLFWKQECEEYTPDGKPTVWHYIKEY